MRIFRGSAESTRTAHTLISALIKDPDKDIEQLIRKYSSRSKSIATATTTTTTSSSSLLTINTSMWHNSMAANIGLTTVLTSTTTTTVTTSTPAVGAQKTATGKPGSHSKSRAAPPTGSAVNNSAISPMMSQPTSNGAVVRAPGVIGSSRTHPGIPTVSLGNLPPTMSAWSAFPAQQQAAPAGMSSPKRSKTSHPAVSAPLPSTSASPKSASSVSRQLFPVGEASKLSSASQNDINTVTTTMMNTYSVTNPATQMKMSLSSNASSISSSNIFSAPSHLQKPASSSSSSAAPNKPSPQASPSPGTSLPPPAPRSDLQPLPIKMSSSSGGATLSTGVTTPGEYSPFNNLFSQVAEQVLGGKSKDDFAGDSRMNFASVAAAGVIGSINQGSCSSPGPPAPLLTPDNDNAGSTNPEKAPGYNKPASARTASPHHAYGYKGGLHGAVGQMPHHSATLQTQATTNQGGPGAEVDFSRVPTFKTNMFSMPSHQSSIGSPRSGNTTPGLSPRAGGGPIGQPHQPQQQGMDPATFTSHQLPHHHGNHPLSMHPVHHHHHHAFSHHQIQHPGSIRDEYSTPNQPMTLPKIESTLNPNAPDFTCRGGMGLGSVQHLHQHQGLNAFRLNMQGFGTAIPPPPPPPAFRSQHPGFMGQSSGLGSNMPGSSSGNHGFMPSNGINGPSSVDYSSVNGGLGGGYANMNGPFATTGVGSIQRQYSPLPIAPRSTSTTPSVGTSSKGNALPECVMLKWSRSMFYNLKISFKINCFYELLKLLEIVPTADKACEHIL